MIATSIVDAQRDPSVVPPGGLFVLRTHTLRPAIPSGPVLPPPPPSNQTVAVAGPKNAVTFARAFLLDGTQSTSADGKPLAYLWTLAPGSPAAAILAAATATPTVQFTLGHTVYTFQLTVTDSSGGVSTDLVSVSFQGN